MAVSPNSIMLTLRCKLKLLLMVLSVMVLVFAFMPTFSAKAYSYRTVSVNTGEISLGSGLKIELTYEFRVSCNLASSTVRAGDTSTGNLKMEDGKIRIAVYVPAPIDQRFETEYNFPNYVDFTNLDIPITTFINANVKLVPTALMSMSGSAPVSVSPNTITFGYMDFSKGFTLSVDSSAQGGTTHYLEQHFTIEVRVGLSINFLTFDYDVVSVPIGSLSLTPVQFESIRVSEWYETLNPTSIAVTLGVIGVIIALIIAVFHSVRKRKHELEQLKQKEATVTTYMRVCTW